jgi:hypothetical protein
VAFSSQAPGAQEDARSSIACEMILFFCRGPFRSVTFPLYSKAKIHLQLE